MIEIREAILEDYIAIHHLNYEEMKYDFSLEDTKNQLKKILDSSKDMVLVAIINGEVAGYVHANDYDLIYAPHMKNIMGIAVFEKYKRKGVGKKLIMRIEDWAIKTNAEYIRLVSGFEREEAHTFYKSCGYICNKQQVNFKKKLRG